MIQEDTNYVKITHRTKETTFSESGNGYDTNWITSKARRYFIINSGNRPRPKVFPIGENIKGNNSSRHKTQKDGSRIRDQITGSVQTSPTNGAATMIVGAIDANYHKGGGTRTMIGWSKSTRDWGVEQRFKIGEANTLNTGEGCGNQSTYNYVIQKSRVRRLTPLECERLQGLPELKIIITLNIHNNSWQSDYQKHYVSVGQPCLKLQNVAGSAEKDNLYDPVISATNHINSKNPQTKKHAPENVHISYEGEILEIRNHKKLILSANTVIKQNKSPHPKVADFARQLVRMHGCLDKIAIDGKEASHLKGMLGSLETNGTRQSLRSGSETMQHAKTALKDSSMMEDVPTMCTMSSHFNTKNIDKSWEISFCSALDVIIGFIRQKTKLKNFSACLEIITGYTEYGASGNKISDTQRYKCIGNAVTVPVIEYIVERLDNEIFVESTKRIQ